MSDALILEQISWRAYRKAILDRLRGEMSNRPGYERSPFDVRTPETERLFMEWRGHREALFESRRMGSKSKRRQYRWPK